MAVNIVNTHSCSSYTQHLFFNFLAKKEAAKKYYNQYFFFAPLFYNRIFLKTGQIMTGSCKLGNSEWRKFKIQN